MVGDKQHAVIEKMLLDRLSPAVFEQRRIFCGNPAKFQGDERDIIFLSLVDSKEDDAGPLSLREDGADGIWKKRYNVATSRAKDQLWVVHSLDSQTQLKPNDIRRKLIEHAIDPSRLMNDLDAGLRKTESPFEAEVFRLLAARGYRVTPQWQVGAYRIDMVVEGKGGRLAVECDGERWHYDKVEEDLARQALLERLGWTFVRIRGSVFYRDNTPARAGAMKPVYEKLAALGIEPSDEQHPVEPAEVTSKLLEAVKRRAHETLLEISSASRASKPKDTVAVQSRSESVQPNPPVPPHGSTDALHATPDGALPLGMQAQLFDGQNSSES
jgi:very-short-patch-repair endonuclease